MKTFNPKTIADIASYLPQATEELRAEIINDFERNINNKSLIENMKGRTFLGTYLGDILEKIIKEDLKNQWVNIMYCMWNNHIKEDLKKIRSEIIKEVVALY